MIKRLLSFLIVILSSSSIAGCTSADWDSPHSEVDVFETITASDGGICDEETGRCGGDVKSPSKDDANVPSRDSKAASDAQASDTDVIQGKNDGGGVECTDPSDPKTEWCDQRDNDCDGVIDEGHVCPDDSVSNTNPFSGAVYVRGTTSEGACWLTALKQVWPTLDSGHYGNFSCHAEHFHIRRQDNEIFYTQTFDGLKQRTGEDSESDTLIETPPCGRQVASIFGFDGEKRLYYRCSDTLRRGEGAQVASEIEKFVMVLEDGRSIVLRESKKARGIAYVVLDKEGNALSRLDPRDKFVGDLTTAPGSVSKQGNRGYVLFERTWGQGKKEYVAYRLTKDGQWQLMRRVMVDEFGPSIIISDGTVLLNQDDPSTTGSNQIVAYKPDGTKEVIWREANASEVRQHGSVQFIVGPEGTP